MFPEAVDYLKNRFLNKNRYKTHSEAVIVSCFFNPQNSPYRLLAFQKFYRSIKHLNHRIIECVIGDAESQLPDSPYITKVSTDSLLWHKEALLNKVISELPSKYHYVFWVDADVKFTNLNWLVDGVAALQQKNIIQPFEYCVHLDRNQTEPDFNVDVQRAAVSDPQARHPKMWRSFAANYASTNLSHNTNYDVHGHVGFAWGARRGVLDEINLYDKALIGGADHIMAHAAAGQIPHECIIKSFRDDLDAVENWMNEFYRVVHGHIGYVPGDLYHYWHGDIDKRQYLKRIKDFTPLSKEIVEKDANGLFVKPNDPYLQAYFRQREISANDLEFDGFDEGFYEDMGYVLVDMLAAIATDEIYQEPEIGGAGSDFPEAYPNNEDSSPMFSTDNYSDNEDSSPMFGEGSSSENFS